MSSTSGGKKAPGSLSYPSNSRVNRRKPPSSRGGNVEIGPHNFKDHFDADVLEYVCEDIRLSTLQRKLVRENNSLVGHALACQVMNFIVQV